MTTDTAAWVVNWICVVMMFAGLALLSRQLDRVNELQRESAHDRADLRASIGLLSKVPPQVLAQVLEMRAEHKHMLELIRPEVRDAWHAGQHMKHATGAKR